MLAEVLSEAAAHGGVVTFKMHPKQYGSASLLFTGWLEIDGRKYAKDLSGYMNDEDAIARGLREVLGQHLQSIEESIVVH